MATISESTVADIYTGVLGLLPPKDAINWLTGPDYLDRPLDIAANLVLDAFQNQYTAGVDDPAFLSSSSSEAFVRAVYARVFGLSDAELAAQSEGVAYWVSQLNNPPSAYDATNGGRGSLISTMLDVVLDKSQYVGDSVVEKARALFENREIATRFFRCNEPLANDQEWSRDLASSITENPRSLIDTALDYFATLEQRILANATGQTIFGTDGDDSTANGTALNGTDGNDRIDGKGGTDVIDGGYGGDVIWGHGTIYGGYTDFGNDPHSGDYNGGIDVIYGRSGIGSNTISNRHGGISYGGEGVDVMSGGIAYGQNLGIAWGGPGNDFISGLQVMIGGPGNDQFYSSYDVVYHVFNPGDGQDFFETSYADLDIIFFGEGIRPEDIQVSREPSAFGRQLILDFKNSDDQITIDRFYLGGRNAVEKLVFSDGTAIDLPSVIDELNLQPGAALVDLVGVSNPLPDLLLDLP